MSTEDHDRSIYREKPVVSHVSFWISVVIIAAFVVTWWFDQGPGSATWAGF